MLKPCLLTCLKCNCITVTDTRLKISNHVKNLRLQFFPQIVTIMIFTISSPATATEVVHISADTVKSIFFMFLTLRGTNAQLH